MTITKRSLKLDRAKQCGPNSKQCGNACIPRDNKCNNGIRAKAEVGAVVGGFASQVVGTSVGLYGLVKGNTKLMNAGVDVAAAGQAVSGVGQISMGKRLNNKNMIRGGIESVGRASLVAGVNALEKRQNRRIEMRNKAVYANSPAGRAEMFKEMRAKVAEGRKEAARRNAANKRDSVWATGFNIGD